MATYDGPGGTATVGYHFHLTDWLGTERMQTTAAGNQEETCTSYPFGDGLNCTGQSADATEHHFTGKERDNESGNDYFGARYYGSSMGRFMSPDWSVKEEPVPYAKMDDPQSLNLYAYLRDNPLAGVDADGHGGAERAKQEPGDQPGGQDTLHVCSGAEQGAGKCSGGDVSIIQGTGQQQAPSIGGVGIAGGAAGAANTPPSRLVIEPNKTENHGSYSIFSYQLEDSRGQALTGNGYSVEEHLWTDRAAHHHAHIANNSEDSFTPMDWGNGGEARDWVGYLQRAPGQGSFNVYQTFTVKYGGRNYNLTTEFEHETVIDDRRNYFNNVVDVIP